MGKAGCALYKGRCVAGLQCRCVPLPPCRRCLLPSLLTLQSYTNPLYETTVEDEEEVVEDEEDWEEEVEVVDSYMEGTVYAAFPSTPHLLVPSSADNAFPGTSAHACLLTHCGGQHSDTWPAALPAAKILALLQNSPPLPATAAW